MQSRGTDNLKGIDVSHYQGTIDYEKVKNAGIQVVYTKATEGVTYKDPTLNANYENAKARGLKVGLYHFFRAKDEDNAKQQAQFFADTIKGLDYDCRLMLDLETTQGLDKDTLSNLAKIFMDEVKRLTGKEVVLYTYTSFARNNITDVLKDYPLWIAHYGVSTPGSNPIWDSWIGFQYTSTGSLDGVPGNVDMNEFTPEILLSKATQAVNSQQPVANTLVKYVQAVINARYGFKIDVDNVAGKQTYKALYAAVQIELNKLGKNLVIDGKPGPKTFGAVVTIRKGDKSNLVWLVQAILICKGYNVGPSGADSDFGTNTLVGVQHYQAAKGLKTDGIVGPLTWKSLLS